MKARDEHTSWNIFRANFETGDFSVTIRTEEKPIPIFNLFQTLNTKPLDLS
jgi:hypothetical protein